MIIIASILFILDVILIDYLLKIRRVYKTGEIIEKYIPIWIDTYFFYHLEKNEETDKVTVSIGIINVKY